jgi:hypothetical protein
VPRLIFNAKTLKLCSKIKFATQAQHRAVSIRCRMFSVMSELYQAEELTLSRCLPGYLENGHGSMQSACLKGATRRLLHRNNCGLMRPCNAWRKCGLHHSTIPAVVSK